MVEKPGSESVTPEHIAMLKTVLDEHSKRHGIEWGTPEHDAAARHLYALFETGIDNADALLEAMRTRRTA